MKWRKLTLTQDQIIAGIQLRIMAEASKILRRAGAPSDAALFTSSLPDSSGAVNIYFSPAAADLVTVVAAPAVRCEPPGAANVSLSVGRQSAWELLT